MSGLGLVLAFVAAACWGAYLVLAKRAVTGLDPLAVATLMMAGSAILLTPLFVVSGVHIVGYGSAIALGAVVAVLSSALPFLLELVALRRVRAATYGVLGQRLSLVETAAIGAVMAAAAGASWTGSPEGPGVDLPAV